MSMFCYQCEQAAKGTGCTTFGVCGKSPEVAALQDVLVQACKGIGMIAHRARALGVVDNETDVFIIEAMFTTVTNVNFDADRVEAMIHRASKVKESILLQYEAACAAAGKQPEQLNGAAAWQPADSREGLLAQGEAIGIAARQAELGNDVTALQELLTYGMKGMAAYADHAYVLGKEDPAVFAFFHFTLLLLQVVHVMDRLIHTAQRQVFMRDCQQRAHLRLGAMTELNIGKRTEKKKPAGKECKTGGQMPPR